MNATINWYFGMNNMPLLTLHPKNPCVDFKYQQVNTRYYYAENDVVANWYLAEGYGYNTITITLLQGGTKTLIGPWHSPISVVNRQQLWANYPGYKEPVVACIYGSYLLACPLSVARRFSPAPLVCVLANGEVVPSPPPLGVAFQYVPSLSTTELKKSNV